MKNVFLVKCLLLLLAGPAVEAQKPDRQGNFLLSGKTVPNAGSGFFNSYFGARAGAQSVNADANAFLGAYAGFRNESGYGNTFVGAWAGCSNQSGAYNAVLGLHAGPAGDGSFNVILGAESGKSSKADHNAFLGYRAGYENTEGAYNTYLGSGAGGRPDIHSATALGAGAYVEASNALVLGNGANVGIGVQAPTYQLHLSSASAGKPGSPLWRVPADVRLLRDTAAFTAGLAELKHINPISFRYNGTAGLDSSDRFVGLRPHELVIVMPDMVGKFDYQDSTGKRVEYQDVDATALIYMLVNAVREQQVLIEEQNVKIDRLSKEVSGIRSAKKQIFNGKKP